MPVKSIRFPNQTTYDGKITSLTENEKEVLKKAGIGGSIYVYYMTPGDNNINPDPDVFGDLSSFTISDKVNPVK